MRKFITLIAAIITVIFLALGYFYWKEKTSGFTPTATTKVANEKKPKEKAETANIDLLANAKNWPDLAQDAFEEALQEGRTYKIALVGSESLGKKEDGWSVKLEEALNEVYGDAIDIGIFEYAERSDEFISKGHDKKVAEFKPNFVLFEPFTLNDNGNVEVEDSHHNIKTFMDEVKGTVFVLQPPHPIHGATFYPAQVEQLEDFANKEGLVFLNHWSEWPDQSDENLRTYLIEEQGAPNKKGHDIWFKYLKDYFIAE